MTAPDTTVAPLSPEIIRRLRDLNDRFTDVGAAERANYQIYLMKLCEAIGVEEPRPAAVGGRVAEHTAYQFEFPVQTTTRDGVVSTNFIDLYKSGCFALEAKQSADGASANTLLTKAFGQVSNYARDLSDRPPYIMVLDVGKTLIIWDRWQGSYGGFQLGMRMDLRTLADRPQDVALLRDIWNNPSLRDPRRHAQAITVEIAGLLAELSATLESRGHESERVARFLIRCVFSMFAEDVKLLPNKAFTRLLDAVIAEPPERFVEAAENLWKAMDAGSIFGYDRILRFNGHFFASAEALPLQRKELELLRRASAADWSAVEPSIFGTLLVRALTPEERHRLGAEYTPRAFIERLVRPTVEEPVRERWTAVQAEVMQLRESFTLPTSTTRKLTKAERDKSAEVRAIWAAPVLGFHKWLRGLRILDPACGSGNFLYVTMHALKRVEVEVFRLLADVQGGQISTRMDEIDPGQFYGIEVKAWAREIAELTLWIGFHQFWRQQHGDVQPVEPLLRDTGTIECRDAVLAWDAIVHRPEKDRLDPTPRIVHPVTGQLVPDPQAKLKYWEYVGARQAEWPEADFIVGNPPFLGQARQRDAFGDGYVDALRRAYDDVADSVDFVMYWWHRAARAAAADRIVRAGLITTSSLVQVWNREVIAKAMRSGVRVVWAIPDHPWVDESGSADVRVAMTVMSVEGIPAVRFTVGNDGIVIREEHATRLNADLTALADVATSARTALRANDAMCAQGMGLRGAGFLVDSDEAERLGAADLSNAAILKPYRNGRDLASRPRNVYVIDFGLMDEENARKYPLLFDIVRARVKPDRDAHARESLKRFWWRFGWPRGDLRDAIRGLERFVVTVGTAKHRFFTFLPVATTPDEKLVCIPSDDAFVLGALSSRIHVAWALATGGRLGVGNDPVYVKSTGFDAFPFPDPSDTGRTSVRDTAEHLDAHRKSAIARDERVTMTGMYNVVAKLRSGEALTPKERTIHELAACGVLRDIHDELDALVADAYGWPWPMTDAEILDRLVALHDVRVEEESRGIIRWLRPEFQAPGQTVAAPPAELALATDAPATTVVADAIRPWPAEAVEQIGALKRLVSGGTLSVDDAMARFNGAKRVIVARHLETLAILGEVRELADGMYGAAAAA
jgi:hypothetical protein